MATDPNKTVFISYRRSVSRDRAVLIFNHLRQHGYDVFLDVRTIDSGAFDSVILNQIGARTHFVILIANGSLERCQNEGDWLRREMEEALRLERNIVPIMDEGFDFDREMGFLPSAWREQFKRINSLPWSHYYFEYVLKDLTERFLKPPAFTVTIKPVSSDEQHEVQQRIAQVTQQPTSPPPPKSTPVTTPPPDTEAGRLLRELDDINTPHLRRLEIGQRLAEIGDPRAGIGVLPNGVPDIAWCHVAKGGEITIEKTKFTIQPFYVAKYLTTNAQYGAFVDAPDGYNNPEWWKLFPKEYRPQKLDTPFNSNSNAPRDNISWYQSMAFAHWLDHHYRQNGLFQSVLNLNPADWKISLPPEWYWQFMAQNGDPKRDYPWGKWDNQPRANTTEASINNKSTAVGMYPHGVAECGAMDVAGNLWEWCLNDYNSISTMNGYSNSKYKVLRGGSFYYYQFNARAVIRYDHNPYLVYYSFGVRLFLLPIVSVL